MVCNNVKVELLLPTIYDKTHPWLSVQDWYKTLRPVLYPATVPKKKVSTIMIDMGHGGSDPGALGVFSKEKISADNKQGYAPASEHSKHYGKALLDRHNFIRPL